MHRSAAHSRFSLLKLTAFIVANLFTGSVFVMGFLIYWGVK